MRPIDASKLLFEIQVCSWDSERDKDMAEDLVLGMPTLTPPNEWVKVMEAINNAAVAYIEGGPYENDLPGMEFALKIDRLSRDFVHPPEGEEDKPTEPPNM